MGEKFSAEEKTTDSETTHKDGSLGSDDPEH